MERLRDAGINLFTGGIELTKNSLKSSISIEDAVGALDGRDFSVKTIKDGFRMEVTLNSSQAGLSRAAGDFDKAIDIILKGDFIYGDVGSSFFGLLGTARQMEGEVNALTFNDFHTKLDFHIESTSEDGITRISDVKADIGILFDRDNQNKPAGLEIRLDSKSDLQNQGLSVKFENILSLGISDAGLSKVVEIAVVRLASGGNAYSMAQKLSEIRLEGKSAGTVSVSENVGEARATLTAQGGSVTGIEVVSRDNPEKCISYQSGELSEELCDFIIKSFRGDITVEELATMIASKGKLVDVAAGKKSFSDFKDVSGNSLLTVSFGDGETVTYLVSDAAASVETAGESGVTAEAPGGSARAQAEERQAGGIQRKPLISGEKVVEGSTEAGGKESLQAGDKALSPETEKKSAETKTDESSLKSDIGETSLKTDLGKEGELTVKLTPEEKAVLAEVQGIEAKEKAQYEKGMAEAMKKENIGKWIDVGGGYQTRQFAEGSFESRFVGADYTKWDTVKAATREEAKLKWAAEEIRVKIKHAKEGAASQEKTAKIADKRMARKKAAIEKSLFEGEKSQLSLDIAKAELKLAGGKGKMSKELDSLATGLKTEKAALEKELSGKLAPVVSELRKELWRWKLR
jgi:hypothetical protein